MVVLNALFLIAMGYISDGYPSDQWFDKFLTLLWLSFFVSIIVTFLDFVFLLKKHKHGTIGKDGDCIFFNFAIVVMCILTILSTAGVIYSRDKYPYASSENSSTGLEYLYGINLDTLSHYLNDSKDATLIYIGRSDCKECAEFENEFIYRLQKNSVEVPTYYTNQDRDGINSDIMYELLDRYDISSVPCVIYVEDGDVKQVWIDPAHHLDEIEQLM